MVRTRAALRESSEIPSTRRKRRASSIASANGDVEPASNNNSLAKPTRKRRTRRTDTEQLEQELGDATEDTEQHSVHHTGHEDTIISVESNTEVTEYSRHVHFSGSVQPNGLSASSPPPASTVAHYMTRSSQSPTNQIPPTKSRKMTRHSLPARLPGTPDRLIDHIQFAPLKQTLSARNQRRLKRNHLSEEMNNIEEHEKDDARKDRELKRLYKEIEEKNQLLRDLNWEVEDIRQRGINIGESDDDVNAARIAALEEELAKMNEELTARNDGLSYHGSQAGDTDVEDDMVFIDPNDINISQEDMTPIQSSFERAKARPIAGSPSPSLDPSRELEINKFEQAIFKLTKEAADARAALQNVDIELQSLGFTSPDEPGLVVCAAIRQAFHQTHFEAEELIPDQSPANYEGGEFLKLLMDNIRGLLQQVDNDLQTIRKHEEMEALLRGQHKGLLDELTQMDARKNTLEKHWKALDRELDSKSKRIVELEQSYESLETTTQTQFADIGQKQERIDELEFNNTEQEQSIQRLKEALEKYRTDLASMEAMVKDMEKEHAAQVAQIEGDAADEIDKLNRELALEQANRETAEAEIDEKMTEVTRLQVSIEEVERELDQLKQQLEDSKAHAASETELREETEAENAQKADFIDELEGKIEQLEIDLENFRTESSQLSDLLATERRQREAAETELDTRNEKIADLESRLHDEGVRGNELRMKLFQEQQDRDRAVADLEADAAEREGQYQTDMEVEISRREDSERVVATRDSKIGELEEKIQKLDESMVELIKAKDELQQECEAEIERLETDLAVLKDEYNELMKSKDDEIQNLHNDVSELSRSLEERAERIGELELENNDISQARQAENEEKDGQIADLQDDLNIARSKINALENERSGLELRVEQEASHFLQYQNESANKIDKLQNDLRDKKKEIKTLQQDAANTQQTHDSEIESKNTEIIDLQVTNTAATVDITKLNGQIAFLQQKLREHVKFGGEAVPDMLNVLKQAIAQAEVIGGNLVNNGEQVLGEVEDIDVVEWNGGALVVPVPVNNGTTVKKVTKKVRTTRRTHVIRDSGIGMGSDEVEAEEEALYA
jgi:chromosome segregation ATPase